MNKEHTLQLKAEFISVKFISGNTLCGVTNEFKVTDSDNSFYIGKVIVIQNLGKNQYIGWNYDNKKDVCKSIDEFKDVQQIGVINFIKK